MSATLRRRCPVCYRRVNPTGGGNIYGHWDGIGRDLCPGSWQTYDIAIADQRRCGPGRNYRLYRDVQESA
jgi:hypothetical protein